MPTKPIRDAIQAELTRQGWTRYRLFKESGVPETAIREYLDGTRDVQVSRAEAMMEALGITVRVNKRRKG